MTDTFDINFNHYQKGFWKNHLINIFQDNQAKSSLDTINTPHFMDIEQQHLVVKLLSNQLENIKDEASLFSLARHFCAISKKYHFTLDDQVTSSLLGKIKSDAEKYRGTVVVDYTNQPKLIDPSKFTIFHSTQLKQTNKIFNNLVEVKQYISELCKSLDPDSRYITELMAIVNKAKDIADLEKLLFTENCRGLKWSGVKVFAEMPLDCKIRCNLITTETWLERFNETEERFIINELIPNLKNTRRDKPIRILSLPCSHGEEAFTLAKFCVQANADQFQIQGYDIQNVCIQKAIKDLETNFSDYKNRIQFSCQDVFSREFEQTAKTKEGIYDWVVCRNFLGYFQPEVARKIIQELYNLTSNGGYLMLDNFIVNTKHPELFKELVNDKIDHQPLFRIHKYT